jgi:hypothetical protein
MDYPRGPAPALVGLVARGVAEPSVGAVIDFSRCPGRGLAGIGLGLAGAEEKKPAAGKPEATWLGLLIDRQWELAIEGRAIGVQDKAFLLPAEFRDAMKAGGQKLGMMARIAARELEVTLRAGSAEANSGSATKIALAMDSAAKQAGLVTFRAGVSLTDAQRRRLLEGSITILSRGGWHGVTPYVDVKATGEK